METYAFTTNIIEKEYNFKYVIYIFNSYHKLNALFQ